MSTNPIQSVFWLVLSFLLGSSVMIFMGLDFFPLILIIIYIGAIVILFLFVIMMLQLNQISKSSIYNTIPILSMLILISLGNVLLILKSSSINKLFNSTKNWNTTSKTDLSLISELLYTYYITPLIIITTLLLVGLVGVIILGLESSEKRTQDLSIQQQRNNSWI